MKYLADISEVELEEIFNNLPFVEFVSMQKERRDDYGPFLSTLGIIVFCTVDKLSVIVHLDLDADQATAYYESDELYAYFPWLSFVGELCKRGYLANLFKN